MVIIYLYDSTVTDFTYNGQPLNKAYEVVVDNIINDSFFVTFNHPLDDKGIYKTIEKDKIVKVHTPDGMQPFRVMDRVKYMDHVSIEAWPLFYADMRNKLVKPLSIRGLSGQAAVNTFVNNLLIDTPFTFTSNITDAHDYHTQDTEERENNPNQLYNALDVFKDIVTRWQGELVINGYDIRVVNRLGKNTGALLYEKKNISDFTDEESIQDVTTRLYGKSEWTERPEGSDEEVKHEISVKIESPLINAYSGIVFEKQYTNNDIRTEKEMRDWLNLKFTTENIDKPSRNIKVGTNIVDDTVIDLGDSLVLKYVKHDVDMEIRMVGYTYDGYANRYITIQLGDAKQSYIGNVQNTVKELETNVNSSVKQTVNQILNANGERMIYSVNEPVGNFKNGDVWFDQQGGMYFWDEEKGMWVDHPYNRNMNVVAGKVDDAEKVAAEAVQAAKDADEKANSAIEKAGANANLLTTHQNTIDTINTITLPDIASSAGTALANAKSAMDEAKLADSKIANFVTTNGLVSGTTVDSKIDTAKGEITAKLTELETSKLDSTTYTNFYENDYKRTAKGVTDTWEAVNKIVDENGNTTDTFAKAVYDKNATRRTESFNEVTKDLVKEATYTAGINGLSGSISTISGQLDKLKVGGGGRNYALKSNVYYYTTDYKVAEYDLAKILKGTKIKISIWGALSANVRTFGVYVNNGMGTPSNNSQIIELTKLDGVHGQGVSEPLSKWTGEATLLVDATKILIFGLDNNSTSPKRVEYVKVETGETFTDWTVAPEDMLGKAEFQIFKTTYEANDQAIKARLLAVDSGKEGSIAYRLNETEKTASGNTTTISDIKTKPGEQITGYQTIKERSDLYERVIGNDEAGIKSNMARMVMTDSLFKTEVIKNVPSAIGGRNYVLKSNAYYYTNNYKVAEYDLSTIPKGTKIKISLWGGLGSAVRTFGVYVNNSSGTASGNSQIIELAKLDGVFGQGVAVPLAKWTAEATLNVDAKKILIYGLDNNNSSPKRVEYVQIETGDYYTDWTAAPEDKANTSSITQLENSIALKVSNAELLSQINLQAGGVLITSGTNKLNITPTTTYIQDATIKSAMIESLEADKITTGTLDAGKVKVINLDANNITANKTNFIQSNWNDISSSVRIDAGGLLSTASDGSQVYLQNGIVGVRNPNGATIGQIGYVYDGGSPTYTIRTTWGSHFGLKQVFYDNFTKGTKEKRVMYASTADDGETTMQFYANSFILHQRKINFGFAHYINGADTNLSIAGQTSITLRANESTIFIVSNNGTNNFATLHANLNMAGNVLTNTSDIRLKRDIVNDEIDSLSALMKWQHAGFNYINPEMNQDRQFSVIAQSAPDIAFTGEDGYLQVALNKQVNMTSHALQQHVIKTNDEVAKLKAQVASLQEELALLKGE
ncbi:Phage-related protein [Aerococcus viridans]|nr:Phage-related protein [Aerococcus viridans]